MAAFSTISSKGQITVPVEVRNRLGVKSGDRVEFVFEDGHTVIRPALRETNIFEQYIGVAPAFSSVEEINAWVRDLRDDEYEAAHTGETPELVAHKL
jgi:antitoxin PrlF